MSTFTAPLPEVSRVRELDLVDKVAVISGASRGIGRAIAFNLASRGCSILGTCTSDASAKSISSVLNDEITSRVFDSTSRVRPASLRIIGLVSDIFSHTCARTIADGISKFFNGRVDIFVNCASDPIPGIIGEMGADEVQRSLLGNVQTPVMIVEELVRRQYFMPNSRIIYISSIRSRQPWSKQLMYAAGKSAGESLCRTWAHAFGGKEERYSFMEGTTANAVTVGLTETDAVVNCGPQAVRQFKDEFFPSQSIPRFGQPDDVADVVGLLCSSDARWITGCVVSASGGGIKIG
jgi:3-oxoacyl-[acyl-carrier protein] reductase